MIGKKLCNNCKIYRPLSAFYKSAYSSDGFQTQCKECQNKKRKKYYEEHKTAERAKRKKYYAENILKCKERARKYRAQNPRKRTERDRRLDKIRYDNRTEDQKEKRRIWEREYQRANKDKVAEWHKKYREAHKQQLKEYDKKYREENKEKLRLARLNRLQSDRNFKLKEQTRNMVRYALREKGHRKNSRTKDIVGCELDFLCDYLFKTWEKNYGQPWDGEPYHIDHIVPLATAHSEEEIIKLCHYTNLQLLTPEDNMEKSDRLPG